MKTRNLILAVLLTVISTATFATDGENNSSSAPKVTVVSNENNVYKLFFRGKSERKTVVNIWDADDRLVFTETIKKYDAFVRPYNFSQLPAGVYVFEVKEGDNTSRRTIYHNVDRATANNISGAVEYPAIVRITSMVDQNDVYKLTIVQPGQKKAVIRVFDNNRHMIYSAVESFQDVFCKLYNLKDIHEKAVVEVEIDGQVSEYVL